MSDTNSANGSTVRLAAASGVPFGKGHDPRRNAGGRVRTEVRSFREAMAVHLPAAVKVIGDLLDHHNAKLRLTAAIEIVDRVVGKPKQLDSDTEANVRAELRVVFGRIKERIGAEQYQVLLSCLGDDGL